MNQDMPSSCHGCGESPIFFRVNVPTTTDQQYEFGCRKCNMYTGPWPTHREAKAKWNFLNPTNTGSVKAAIDELIGCQQCGGHPDVNHQASSFDHGYWDILCPRCQRISGPFPTFDLAKKTWEKMNSKGEKVHKDEVYQKYIDEANRCSVCGELPIIARYNGGQMYEAIHYSFDCTACSRTSGPLPTMLEAKAEWDKLNSLKTEKCQTCGCAPQTAWVLGLNGYRVKCPTCTTFVVHEKLNTAIWNWNLSNRAWRRPSTYNQLREECGELPIITLRGKRVNPCKSCGGEVQIRFDKERHAYEIECTKCKNGVIAQKIDNAIFGWNELNPITPPLKWSYEGSKLLARRNPPPRERYLHYEDRIRDLANGIHNLLVWMAMAEQCTMYPTNGDWTTIERWATELAETCRLRKEEK